MTSSQQSGPVARTLTLGEAQARVDASVRALGGYWPPLANLARLFEECGELARAINQEFGPKLVKTDETRAATSEELGDALYTLLVLANSLDIDANAALADVLAKVQARATTAPSPDPSPALREKGEDDTSRCS